RARRGGGGRRGGRAGRGGRARGGPQDPIADVEPLPAERAVARLGARDVPPVSLGVAGEEDEVAELVLAPDPAPDGELDCVGFPAGPKRGLDIRRVAREVELLLVLHL